MKEVLLPDIGDFHDVEIIEILVKPGDRVEAEDPLITLESDKASMEIPSPQAGVVDEVMVALGDRINQGDLLLTLQAVDEEADAETMQEQPAVQPAEMLEDAPADIPADALPTVPAAPAGEPQLRDVVLPDIGDFQDVEIIELLVTVGDPVAAEQSLLTLESDKATMEIPAPFGGVLRSVAVKVGDKVNRGDLIAAIETRDGGNAETADGGAPQPADTGQAAATADRPAIEAPRAPGDKEQLRRPVLVRPSDTPRGKAHASPGVRRFARKLGVDLHQVSGSAPKGRILKEDVQDYVKRALSGAMPELAAPAATGALQLPAVPEVDFTKFGEVEERDLGRIKKLSGAHLHRAWLNVPHVTQFDEADITELEAFRKTQKDEAARRELKLTFMPFLMTAVAKALARYPQFNSSLSPDGERLILKKYLHIGVAVDTPNGLMVPVVRDVDQKGVFDLARDLGELSGKARAGKLSPADMQGGCLSISSLGGIGGTQFTPIVNAPEVAILGISRAAMQPRWDGSAFVPRLIMPFSLSYDHRVIDGAEGVRFTSHLGELLGDIRRLLL
jgi:pyruvate dehydrogenase E2 component (dihydrolipoamide acetyltransferase)